MAERCCYNQDPATTPLKQPAVNRLALTIASSCLVVAMLSQPGARGETLSADDLAFFENKIRPVLVQHCYECHAADSKELGGKLLLDTRDGMRRGGEAGAAVIQGKPDESLIIQALRYDGLEMPPDQPLPEAIINDFVSWVQRGAPDPRSTVRKEQASTDPDTLWSLQAIANPPLPEVQDQTWPRDPLDRFVLARLEAAELAPTRDADSRVLVRRLYHDLIGLPPTIEVIEEVAAAYQRDGAKAIEPLVDTLLDSPQFGERWGRHWLDVARYAESNGNDGLSRNPTFPHAWRYRDYVIGAFNSDLPYDQFLAEQIAGDLLPSELPEQRDRHLIATGFLAMGAKPAKAMNNDFDMDIVADQIDVISRGVMGLSVACARCHDHKFDPIPTRDYYALAGMFTSTETMWGVAAHEGLTAPVTDLHVLQAAPKVLPSADFVETVLVLESNTGKPKQPPKSKWPLGTPLAMGVRDRSKLADCQINIKGDSKKLGEAVPRGFLTAFEVTSSDAIAIDPKQSGRLQLAQWLTRRDHPLTARVMVNRIWLHLFGEGIVRTPDDFGVYGERPTHPELLDHLATRFMDEGWSIKQLVRAVVLSRTYQLGSDADEELVEADPSNLLQARHNRRRLDAESLRDGMLQVSGQLDLKPADGSIIRHRDILVNLAGNLHQPSNQRSVYLCYLRSSPPPELAAFDLPDFTTVTGQRDKSTVPGQALHLYNSPFVIEQADRLSQRVLSETEETESRVRLAFRRVLCREPGETELAQALELVQLTISNVKSEDKAWASLCQALLVTNEFRYVD